MTEWISTKDKLPTGEQDWVVAVVREKDTGFVWIPRVMEYRKEINDWLFQNDLGWLSEERNSFLEVVAWTPLPEPYRAEMEPGVMATRIYVNVGQENYGPVAIEIPDREIISLMNRFYYIENRWPNMMQSYRRDAVAKADIDRIEYDKKVKQRVAENRAREKAEKEAREKIVCDY